MWILAKDFGSGFGCGSLGMYDYRSRFIPYGCHEQFW